METSLKRSATISRVRELQLPWTEDIELEYDVIREIGSGDYGKVSLAKNKHTTTEVWMDVWMFVCLFLFLLGEKKIYIKSSWTTRTI